MALAGTIRNGQVQLDRPADRPDGTRVTLWPEGDDDFLPPLPNETYAQYIASLRESIDDKNAGRTRPAREVLKEIAMRHGFPLEPGE